MLRRLSKMIAGRILVVTAGLALATAGLSALTVAPASAANDVVVSYWGTGHYEDDDTTYQCGTTWDWEQGANAVDEIYNPCDARVWVHYVSEGTGVVQSYCVNPYGGLAYDIPTSQLQWSSSVTYTNIQLTSNTSQCDSGDNAYVWWNEAGTGYEEEDSYNCFVDSEISYSGFVVEQVQNNCNTRIWLHINSSGTGGTLCMNPGQTTSNYAYTFSYVDITANQALCASPGAPYPY
jgi:hypothetical protein